MALPVLHQNPGYYAPTTDAATGACRSFLGEPDSHHYWIRERVSETEVELLRTVNWIILHVRNTLPH